MSLVEKALQKVQAANRAREQQPARVPRPAHEPAVVGRVVAHDPAPSASDNDEWHWNGPARPSRIIRIDRDSLRAAGLLPPEAQERELADQYRTIKRPLIRTAAEPVQSGAASPQLIMMSSALPGDGKTFTCINLALSMALEKDNFVLLVDGDVAKPHVSRVFGVDREPGLLDVLADPAMNVESVILPTDIPGLSILPAGCRSDIATELLASARTQQVLDRLAALGRRGIVLLDSPPILLTSEARVLASLAGQIVLVVKAGQTPQHAVKDAVEIIGPGKNVRLVLNQADLTGPMGYYYGYRYGYHDAAADRGVRAEKLNEAVGS